VEVWGDVKECSATVESHCTLPLDPENLDGWFLCSDELLNRIWFAALYTAQLNCMYNNPSPGPYGDDLEGLNSYAFYDGPRRDRRIFTWFDSTGNRLPYQAFDGASVARTTYDFLAGQSPEGDYLCRDEPLDLCLDRSAFTEYDLWEFLLYSGDIDYIRSHAQRIWRHVEDKIRGARGEGGLYAGTLMLPVGPGYATSLPQQTTVYRGLKAAAGLADTLQQKERAGKYRRWAEDLRALVVREFWDEDAGALRYRPGSAHFDEKGNALTCLHGMVSPDRVRRILKLLKNRHWRRWDGEGWGDERPGGPTDFDRPWRTDEEEHDLTDLDWGWDADPDFSPGGSNYNFCIAPQMAATEAAAHFEAGDAADGLTVLRRCFGNMIRRGSDTLWEQADRYGHSRYGCGRNGGSLCHRWSAMAGSVLTNYVLGVRPVRPGYTTFQLAPQCGDLEGAMGRVRTPFGPIEVDWHREGGTFTEEFNIPEGTSCRLRAPFAGKAELDGSSSGTEPTVTEPGRHRFHVSAD
jgi:hypothetical protein